jgi:hypothetical protein
MDLQKKNKSIGFIVTKVEEDYTLERLKKLIKSKIQFAKKKLENVPEGD